MRLLDRPVAWPLAWPLALACALVLLVQPRPAAAGPLTYTITSASATCTAVSDCFISAGRPFHVQLSGTASATCYLVRQVDGSSWAPVTVTVDGTTSILYKWTYASVALSEDVTESQSSVPYRVDCGASLGAYTSGTLTVKFSQ